MKKVLKTVLILFLSIAVILGALALWQWENVKVIFMTINHSQEEIDALVLENEQKTAQLLKKFTDTELQNLTDEEIEKLSKGEMTEEEALKIINKNKSADKIDDIISRVYVLRAEYIGALSALESEALGAKKSIPKEQKTISKKLELIDYYTGRAAELEKQCDAKMEALISELEAELQKSGRDMSLISEVRSAYQGEKSAKKSQLLAKYNKYLK